ncbi:unnamed protein product [Microthlaspi erraticum]|uniref:Replication protein A 70 kDa DNA-binding subunit B/D first OB fold domain-containing protein n=1 Tax=Microthlaspi erraticum TaxID=1685480 RepID=A0A6D2JYW8_9BRAS|nr:unnamed protein product [Microthlaspi erraticum]
MTIGSAFTKLADVRSFKSSWKVRVKVLHSWSQFSGMSGETMELVLADEHKKDIGRLSNELQDGEWKVLENFTLSPATGQFRPTSSKWKMSLFMNTVVFWSILEHMGHKEHGGTWHMEAAQLDTQRKKGEAILKTSSTVHSTNRSSSSTRPAKLQLDRAGSQSQTRKMLLPP